jgi:hypothetical protein
MVSYVISIQGESSYEKTIQSICVGAAGAKDQGLYLRVAFLFLPNSVKRLDTGPNLLILIPDVQCQ